MSLLMEIQESAVDDKADLGVILRKCKVLAARLGSKPLEDWLIWESNGYPRDIMPPEYRIWRVQLKGNFFGPFNMELSNAPIPYVRVPDKLKHFGQFECRESIAAIGGLLEQHKEAVFQTTVGDLALALGSTVYRNMACLQAWGEFGRSQLFEILNTVRNRILDLVLAIDKENPGAGEKSDTVVEPRRISQIFNTTVYGGAANIVGASANSKINFNIGINDFEALKNVLNSIGLDNKDIADLKSALESDPMPTTIKSFGPKVSSWISKVIGKAASGAWDISLSAAGELLAGAIAAYYGLSQ